MKSRLFTLLSAALVAAAVAAPAADAASTTVVISQVSFRGPTGGNDELIQLRNISQVDQPIGGWQIFGSNNTGSSVLSRATIPAGTVLPVGKVYLFTNVQPGGTGASGGSYSGTVPGDQIFTTGVGDTGGIQLRNAAGTVIDRVGATAVIQDFREGAGLLFPTANNDTAYHRNAGADTDDNPTDFASRTRTPENCGTACTVTAPPGPCDPGPGGTTPITSIQTLGGNAACNGTRVTIRGIVTGIDDLYGSNFENIYKADAGIWIQNATRDPQATTSSALFVAGIRRAPGDAADDVIGSDITISGVVHTKFGQVGITPDGVGNISSPLANEVDLSAVATTHSTGNLLPAAVVLDKTASEGQDPITRPYYRSLQGMRVQLPEGIATGGGTTKFRDVFVEPGTNARRLFRKNDQAAISTPWSDAPAELGIAGDGGAGNPPDPRAGFFSRTQVNLDLFDVVRNVVGPLSYGFSFYKIMPQLGGPAPVIQRGAINAAYPPAVPTPAANTLRVASFNVENLFPVGKVNDGQTITQADYDEKVHAIVLAIRNFLKEPDVIAVQEVAVFPDGANALTGLAAALGNYTPHIATNNDGRGIAPGFLVKTGTTASNPRVLGAGEIYNDWSEGTCDLAPNNGKLFDRAPFVLDLKKGDVSFTAMSNHFASQSHENACRIAEAEYVRRQAVALQQAGRHVLVAGDLNDFEFSSALGRLAQGNTLTNLWGKAPANLAYSYKFNGHLQTLDHIFVTAGLESRVTDMRYVHFDNDYYERNPLNAPNPSPVDGTGISDHDPPVATFELLPTSTSTTGTISGNVPATLSLTLGTAPPLGPFTPGVARDYTTTMTATATSTGEDAALSVLDPSANAPGRLVNGTYALRAPLQIATNGGAFTPLRTDNGPLALASWTGPFSGRNVDLGFKQSIAADEGLRTGSYGKTLTFTLSTTNP